MRSAARVAIPASDGPTIFSSGLSEWHAAQPCDVNNVLPLSALPGGSAASSAVPTGWAIGAAPAVAPVPAANADACQFMTKLVRLSIWSARNGPPYTCPHVGIGFG